MFVNDVESRVMEFQIFFSGKKEIDTEKDDKNECLASAPLTVAKDDLPTSQKYNIALSAEKWNEFCKHISDSEETELQYDRSQDGLNPGEVEFVDTESVTPHQHTTKLDFKECTLLPANKALDVARTDYEVRHRHKRSNFLLQILRTKYSTTLCSRKRQNV